MTGALGQGHDGDPPGITAETEPSRQDQMVVRGTGRRVGRVADRTQTLSVIIPARNEQNALPQVLKQVIRSEPSEVIVVDGRSTDGTVEVARSFGVRVVSSLPGRARQMNTGAGVAGGDVLLFLHADTLVPRGYGKHIHRTLKNPDVHAGAFRLGINAPGLAYRVIETLVNLRSSFGRMPYGDQGIFIKAEVFHRLGGFADIPILEDVDMVQKLNRIGAIRTCPVPVTTSARRWRRLGICRTTALNRLSILGYRMGLSPQRIATWHDRQPPTAPNDHP